MAVCAGLIKRPALLEFIKKERDMRLETIDLWTKVSWVMTTVTIAALLLACMLFGVMEVPWMNGQRITFINWPLIVVSLISGIHAMLFAVSFEAIKMSAENSRATLDLLLEQRRDNQRLEPLGGSSLSGRAEPYIDL